MNQPSDTYWNMAPNQPKALMLAQREVAVFVYDAVRLEGINFTLPEIQTLLQGVTIGGHKLSDQQIAVNQGEAWKALFRMIKEGEFEVSQACVCQLHAIAAKEEALEWGQLRTGGVLIAGTDYEPPAAEELPSRFGQMLTDITAYDDAYDQAIHIFLTMARNQFFYDVNKRTGRLIMNGHLLSLGFPAINVPATRQLEFNQLMLRFYETGDMAEMNWFMRSCLNPKAVSIMKE
jgi:Fic family protein